MTEMQPLYRVASVHELDRRAIEQWNIPGYELMTRAAHAALTQLRLDWPYAVDLLVVCGTGNNGGDGLVLARLAKAAGYRTRVLMAEAHEPATADARRAAAEWRAAGGDIEVFAESLPPTDLIVDALFGTGLTRAPEGANARLIEVINAHPAPVFALDVPSGLDADTGAVPGACVKATATITFIAAKRGLYTGAALDYVGRVELAPLGLPAELFSAMASAAARLGRHALAQALPPRRANAHKGDFGHVLVVGGNHGMGGAARLAAEGALRAGAGLVTVATRAGHIAPLLAARPECMVRGVDDIQALQPLLDKATVIAVGPGLGQDTWSRSLLAVCLTSNKPLVLDADALNLLAESPCSLPAAILTPHPGEAARLLGQTVVQVQADRFAAAEALMQKFQATVVLKGAGTVAVAPGEVPCVIAAGNPGMACGGMGDVLTGVVASLYAQGYRPFDAARFGALLHGVAGDQAAADGQRGLLAGDLLTQLRRCANPE